MEKYIFDVSQEFVHNRLDLFLLKHVDDITRSQIKNACDNGLAMVNGKPKKAGYNLRVGDKIEFEKLPPHELSAKPENIPINIIYEDEYLAVINKPQNMVVHPACGNENGTLVNAILYYIKNLSSINGDYRPGIVHRLDKNTSGLLVIAKCNEAHRKLAEAIQKKEAKRFYVALVDGNIKEDDGVIIAPLGRSNKDRKKMAVVSKGRYAETHFKVLERFGRYTFVEFELKTGRTHQIRVHSKYIHHPIVGDDKYGGSNKFNLEGQLLHAYKLIFKHPKTGEIMEFKAEIPKYFQIILDKLRKEN